MTGVLRCLFVTRCQRLGDTFFFLHASGKMAVARHGGWATIGAAERMQIETQKLDELMRGADGGTGDVRDALYEAVGVRPTLMNY